MVTRWTAGLVMAALVVAAPAAADTAGARIRSYRALLELNGVAGNIHDYVHSTRAEAQAAVAEHLGEIALTPEQQAAFDAVASPAFAEAEQQILDDIARTQSAQFTEAEINSLYAASSGPVARRFYELKRAATSDTFNTVDVYMQDAVDRIVSQFTGVTLVSAPLDAPESQSPARHLLEVEGTGALTRSMVVRSHMEAVMAAVEAQTGMGGLSEAERYRLTSITAQEGARLADKILAQIADTCAQGLTDEEIAQLTAAMDVPAQKKLTRLRMTDDGSLDARAAKRVEDAVEASFAPYR